MVAVAHRLTIQPAADEPSCLSDAWGCPWIAAQPWRATGLQLVSVQSRTRSNLGNRTADAYCHRLVELPVRSKTATALRSSGSTINLYCGLRYHHVGWFSS